MWAVSGLIIAMVLEVEKTYWNLEWMCSVIEPYKKSLKETIIKGGNQHFL